MTEHTGWSVVVVGIALLETAPEALRVYRQSARPRLSGAVADILSTLRPPCNQSVGWSGVSLRMGVAEMKAGQGGKGP